MANRKVMIALDGKRQSEYALDWYLENMSKQSDHVLLFHCSKFELNVGLPGIATDYGQVGEKVKKAKEEAEKIPVPGSQKLQQHNIKCWTVIKQNQKPYQSICDVADQEGVDHIIMGTRDLGSFQRAFVGSVSTEVVHHSNVPVTIVKMPAEHQ